MQTDKKAQTDEKKFKRKEAGWAGAWEIGDRG